MSEPARTPSLLRQIPQVDRLLSSAELQPLLRSHPRKRILSQLRDTLDELRRLAREGALRSEDLEVGAICERLERRLVRGAVPYYRRVVNATGVVLHTGLGRSPLAAAAVAALSELAPHPQRVEIDLTSGRRGARDRGCELLLRELTGAEAATVVNNNAAATLLILAALARGRRVLVSRGEMVEIGGSFRIPEIMRESGARLVEVGTTNRTHEQDYRSAIDAETGLILKVHPSNYRVVGFTSEVDLATLVAIGREHRVPVVHDLGSGCLIDLAAHGRPGEQIVRASVAAGAELVCFSGDKLLGGPQAGLIVGRPPAVDQCRRHPLYRTLRPGRLIYTALEATLRLYLEEDEEVLRIIPALRCLTAGTDELRRRAQAMARRLGRLSGFEVAAVECTSQAGSGSLPARDLPSWGVRVVPGEGSVADLAAALRCGEPSIVARVQDDAVLFDLRTLADGEIRAIERRFRELGEASSGTD